MKMVALCLAISRIQPSASFLPSCTITVLPRYSGSMRPEPEHVGPVELAGMDDAVGRVGNFGRAFGRSRTSTSPPVPGRSWPGGRAARPWGIRWCRRYRPDRPGSWERVLWGGSQDSMAAREASRLAHLQRRCRCRTPARRAGQQYAAQIVESNTVCPAGRPTWTCRSPARWRRNPWPGRALPRGQQGGSGHRDGAPLHGAQKGGGIRQGIGQRISTRSPVFTPRLRSNWAKREVVSASSL
jgi:hypothetical protein